VTGEAIPADVWHLVSVSLAVLSIVVPLIFAYVNTRLHRREVRREVRRLTAQRQFWVYLETFAEQSRYPHMRERFFLDYVGRRLRLQRFGVLPPRPAGRTSRETVESSWFYLTMFFIPREIRSPWFDHILDDRHRAAAEGHGKLFIAAMTFSQCVSLLVHHFGEIILDVLTPFKRSRIRRSD
jgi:hypothetical protein